jgi:uncharacterized radical SAM protein YgiQ
MTPEEVVARGWDAVDVVFVTGDAYVDHPSFAMALLGRVLEAEGYRVAILSQPDWHSCRPWQTFGRPRLCFAVSAGNMDSMINHYTAGRKVRNDDAYSPGGKIGRRPDRATLAYCQRAREAYHDVPIIAGGVEASLRRLAHYDYWSDKVRRAIVFDAKADLVVYGMGDRPLVEIVRRLDAGCSVRQLHDIRGVVYRLGASEPLPPVRFGPGEGRGEHDMPPLPLTQSRGEQDMPPLPLGEGRGEQDMPPLPLGERRGEGRPLPGNLSDTIILPSYEEVSTDERAFARMTRIIHRETNPHLGRRLVQYHQREAVVVNPPCWPLSESEMDRIYGLPFTRRPHPSYGLQRIPAYEVVKDSIQIMRGCCGGCTFCSLTVHQGRIIQSRSRQSVLAEIRRMAGQPGFTGVVSDLGGPTANMYRMGCTRPEVGRKCRRLSCLHPTICKLLGTDHGPLIRLMKAARRIKGVRQVLIASGIRMDLARRSTAYVSHLVRHHTGGRLKVAPEHADPEVLRLMKKPPIGDFEAFARKFRRAAAVAGKEVYLEPYFIAGHPGSDLGATIGLAVFLKHTGYRPDKVQDFIPGPMDIATCMYYTGIDPMSGESVYVPRGARERRLQRALLQYWKPENYADVRRALEQANRLDLIGDGPNCLIPARPPQEVRERKSRRATTNPPRKRVTAGYRPHRGGFQRRKRGQSQT